MAFDGAFVVLTLSMRFYAFDGGVSMAFLWSICCAMLSTTFDSRRFYGD